MRDPRRQRILACGAEAPFINLDDGDRAREAQRAIPRLECAMSTIRGRSARRYRSRAAFVERRGAATSASPTPAVAKMGEGDASTASVMSSRTAGFLRSRSLTASRSGSWKSYAGR